MAVTSVAMVLLLCIFVNGDSNSTNAMAGVNLDQSGPDTSVVDDTIKGENSSRNSTQSQDGVKPLAEEVNGAIHQVVYYFVLLLYIYHLSFIIIIHI